MTFTEADLEQLKSALVSGATSISQGDRTVSFASREDIIKTIKLIEDKLSGSAIVTNRITATYNK